MTHDDLNKAIRDVVKGLLSLPDNFVRKANVTGAPSGAVSEAYATVLVAMFQPASQWAGHMEVDHETNPFLLVDKIRQQYEATISLQFFREGALDYGTRIGVLLQSPAATVILQSKNLGLTRISGPKNLSQVVNTLWEERSQLDLGFNVTVEEDTEVTTFGTFPVDLHTADSTQHFEVTTP